MQNYRFAAIGQVINRQYCIV